MTKPFYCWEDTSDKNATGHPDLGTYPEFRLRTKAEVRRDWREYLEMFPDIAVRKPKIRVWRVSFEEVQL
jgi:hypothetical protein